MGRQLKLRMKIRSLILTYNDLKINKYHISFLGTHCTKFGNFQAKDIEQITFFQRATV